MLPSFSLPTTLSFVPPFTTAESKMAMTNCCLKSFAWEGTPTGTVSKLGDINTYITGTNSERAVLYIHDALGWTFPNARLLADHFAREIDATVYVPDFFDGEILPFEPILAGRWHEIDMAGFQKRNWRDIREPAVFEAARQLRQKGYKRIGAVGYCFGGWASFRVGAKEHNPPLIDCISTGHPTWLTKEDIDGIGVPVQLLAPEHDVTFTAELKSYAFEQIMKKGLYMDYVHLPGVEHGGLVRGDPNVKGEREAMARAKDAAVSWFKMFLYE
jgi:dienelactone hydrolase